MTVSMYSISIPVFIQHLNGLNTVLDKAGQLGCSKTAKQTSHNVRYSPESGHL